MVSQSILFTHGKRTNNRRNARKAIRRSTYNNISMVLGMVDTREKPTSTGNRRRKGGQGTRVGCSSPSPGSRRTAAERTRRSYQRCLAALSYWA